VLIDGTIGLDIPGSIKHEVRACCDHSHNKKGDNNSLHDLTVDEGAVFDKSRSIRKLIGAMPSDQILPVAGSP